jgi:hypothetical protein
MPAILSCSALSQSSCHKHRGPDASRGRRQAEADYREILRRQHLAAAFQDLREDIHALERDDAKLDEQVRQALAFCLGQRSADGFLRSIQPDIAAEQATEDDIL